MTYFKPLLDWLVTENVRQGEILGWPDFSCTFEEKDTDKVTFLSLELDADQAKFGQWVLLALSFVMFLVAYCWPAGCTPWKKGHCPRTPRHRTPVHRTPVHSRHSPGPTSWG
ncbi:angiotensin-converting enzyme-like protein Ace3 [Felis catus]|uniref:angiotensin-converting enzyme-like protein Ace3 n=1 Tax=Felis catus TaxID=9685 RepID=UPI001D19E7A3|nr:angiotensin-converting enzyme-like protein Ace3 [Felis catus]